MTPKLHTKHDVHAQVVDTVACTVKVKVPDSFTGLLNNLRNRCRVAVREMLAHRNQSSSKYYSTIPCVVSKSLIAKYQRNRKCKSVSNVVIPICGDKGKIVKSEANFSFLNSRTPKPKSLAERTEMRNLVRAIKFAWKRYRLERDIRAFERWQRSTS